MFSRVKWHLNRKWFDLNTKIILDTPPMKCNDCSPVVFVSQLRHRDLLMYLLAVKSLSRFITPQNLFVLDDTSLTAKDKTILHEHIEQIEIISITDINNGKCPKGGTWERLVFISNLNDLYYVIQVDSDTLTLKKPDEVISFIQEERSFTLGGGWSKLQTEISSMEEVYIFKKQQPQVSDHVQSVSEANFDRLPGYKNLKYVRGSSAFAGFARGRISKGNIEAISMSLSKIVGPNKWCEWGSEQVTSNIIVANTPGAGVLPFPKYCSQHPGVDVRESTFIHFIGSHRFIKGNYVALSKQIINELLSSC